MTAGDVEEAAEADPEHVPRPHACTTIRPVLDPHPQALPLITAQKAPVFFEASMSFSVSTVIFGSPVDSSD
ncbi:hypothetical protein TB1_005524 [Malus domestica]